jgi:hypothetical protein
MKGRGHRAEGTGQAANRVGQATNRGAHIAAALLAVVLATGAAGAETIDRVLAVAGGQVIMLSDVTAALDLGLVSDEGAADRIGAALAKLIDRALVLVEVNRYAPPEPADDAIEREMAIVRARFPSRPAFDAVLERSGITEAHLRETVRENLRIRAYIDQRFAGAENQGRRLMLIDEWVAGLRQRADIVDLYATGR